MGRVEAKEVPVPEPADYEIRVKVTYSSICGSDTNTLTAHLGEFEESTKAMLPMPFGHEVSGIIDKVGPKAEALGYHAGNKVVVNYAKYCYACDNCRSGHENLCTNLQFCMNGYGDGVYFTMYGKNPILKVNLHNDFYWNQENPHGVIMGTGLFPKAIKVARRLDLESIIQRVYPLSQYEKAFEDLYTKRFAKIVIKMDE